MKTRCALLILNRMSPIFPNSYVVAKPVQSKLQMLVDEKDKIKPDLWVLANGCNEHLKVKIKTFPEAKELEAKEAAKKKAEEEAQAKRDAEEKKRKQEQMKEIID